MCDDVVGQYRQLTQTEQVKAAAAIRELPAPPPRYVGPLWIMVVSAFIVLMLGGAFLLYLQVKDKSSTTVIAALVTGALGVLAGLLAPSPVSDH
jgi:uncharacterized membrane protein (DUF4010 family)